MVEISICPVYFGSPVNFVSFYWSFLVYFMSSLYNSANCQFTGKQCSYCIV